MDRFDAKAHWETVLEDQAGFAGVGYRGLGEPFNRWMYRVRRQVVLRTLGPHVAGLPVRRVLDIGSGTGFYVDRWRDLGVPDITGSDLTDTVVDRLSRRYPDVRFVRADAGAEGAPLPDGPFGAVSAMDVLFHIVDDERYERAFHNIASVLASGGLFVFSENFVHGDTVRVTDQASRPIGTVLRILDQAGFEPLVRRPMFVLMNEPVDSAGRLHRQFWWKLAGQLRVRGSWASWAAGAALYPLELALVRARREGPSTEIMICRRRA